MAARIDLLEREVSAIESEIAVIKSTCWTRKDARLFDARLCRVGADIAIRKADVAVRKADVARRKADVAQIKIDVAQIRNALTHLATKAALRGLEARLKTWMVTSPFH